MMFSPYQNNQSIFYQPISSPGDMKYRQSSKTAPQNHPLEGPKTHTLDPYVTGASVLGIKFVGGVMLAADTLASYGTLARFRQVSRFTTVGDTLLGASGDISDFQAIKNIVEGMETQDSCFGDDLVRSPQAIYSYLSRLYYGRRCKFNPLWNQILVAGARDGEPFLGYVDLHGTTYEDTQLATGYGAYLARGLLRDAYKPDLTEAEAEEILKKSMEVLYYRDCRTINRIQFAVVKKDGITIKDPIELETKWEFSQFVKSGFQ